MPQDIFISYTHEDEPTALRICQLLEHNGLTCWIAPRELGNASNLWSSGITDAISESRVLLVLISSHSNKSKNVAREVEWADSKNIPLIPVRIEKVEPAGAIVFFLHNIQWSDAFEGRLELHVPGIVDRVRVLLNGSPPTRAPIEIPSSGLSRWLRVNRHKLALGAAGMMTGVLALGLWLWPCKHMYHVHVTVLDIQKRPAEEAVISSNLGGEIDKGIKKVPPGWQVDVPNRNKPPDGKLIIYASTLNGILKGSAELLLGRDCDPAVSVNLQPDATGEVRGTVVDSTGKGVAGARVNVDGFQSEAVITGVGGDFKLAAHVPAENEVRLHVEKEGFSPVDQLHFAGPDPATVTLSKFPKN